MKHAFIAALLFFLLLFVVIGCNVAVTPDEPADNGESHLPADDVIAQEKTRKMEKVAEGFETPWVIGRIEEHAALFDLQGKSVDEISLIHKLAISDRIMTDIEEREVTFRQIYDEKYTDITCSLSYTNIKKGDVILLVSRHVGLMSVDRETTLTHALICVADPVDGDDPVFITANGFLDLYEVHYLSLNNALQNADMGAVLRLYNSDEATINTIADYAKAQVGKDYNAVYFDKETTDAFYCSQLVWRSYLAAGINVDYDHDNYNDYGLVLPSDIYRSPYLYIVDFSE